MPGPLKSEQLKELTGYTMASKQVEWVRKNLGIEPPLRRDGRPSISQEVVDAATLLRRTGPSPVVGIADALAELNRLRPAGTPGPNWRRAKP
jgi:Domain of unknown function (DUF4224)